MDHVYIINENFVLNSARTHIYTLYFHNINAGQSEKGKGAMNNFANVISPIR